MTEKEYPYDLEGASGLKDFIDFCSKEIGEDHLFFKKIMLFMLVRMETEKENEEIANLIDEFIENTVFGYFNFNQNHQNKEVVS